VKPSGTRDVRGALRNTSWPAQAQLTALHVNETAAFSAAQDASEAG